MKSSDHKADDFSALIDAGYKAKRSAAYRPWTCDELKTLSDAFVGWESGKLISSYTNEPYRWLSETVMKNSRSVTEVRRKTYEWLQRGVWGNVSASIGASGRDTFYD